MEDPLTSHFPSRTQIDEEEELAAQEWSERLTTPPQFEWAPAAQGLLRDTKLPTQLLVLATSAAACTLLEQCLQDAELLGSMQQPEVLQGAPPALRSLMEGPTGRQSRCVLCAAPGGAVAALCRSSIPPERAAAFADGLFARLQPAQVVCVSSLPAHQYLGEQDPTQQSQHFVVETSSARGKLPHGIPRLPTGNLVSGLPAAVASFCQVHRIPATVLVSVDASPFPDSIGVRALAHALAALLQHTEAAALGAALSEPDALGEACRQMRKAVRLSDRAAIYM